MLEFPYKNPETILVIEWDCRSAVLANTWSLTVGNIDLLLPVVACIFNAVRWVRVMVPPQLHKCTIWKSDAQSVKR